MNISARLQLHDDPTNKMQVGKMTFLFKVRSSETEGAYTMMEAIVPPESGSGLHRHWSYDEAAQVLEGTFECYVDGAQRLLTAGQSVYWPRGALHKFRSVGPQTGRILFICSPGRGFEEFAHRISQPELETGTASSGPAMPFRSIAADYGIEFVDA
jgi:quercetin dioxygenase-like cupin family protein